eukprot:GHVR01047092.1.p1 GENE.GHVR01047092.1~~GHVR01047092.1.p1  ORF type:complete len:570 (-),score=157.60 GHVR01047092.1:183-1892(-)
MTSFIGESTSGQDVRGSNVMAVNALANILKTSLGPHGLDKMLVDDIGDVTVTNDGATILRQLEVQHPAAKVLVDLSKLQDDAVGDGTTSVVIIAAELLKRGNELVKDGIHPTTVISGYKLACKEAVSFIKKKLQVPVNSLDKDAITNIAKTTLSSKLVSSESDMFASLVVQACDKVKYIPKHGGPCRYPVDSVNILKCHGRGVCESQLIDGYGMMMGRACQGMPQVVKQAKVALLDFNLNKARMQLGITIQVEDPKELEKIRKRELDISKEILAKILDSGANVVVTTKGIDDTNQKYLVERGCLGLRRVDKKDMRRLAKATGGRVCVSLADVEGGDTFQPEWLGSCDQVCEERLGDNDFVFFKGCVKTSSVSIVIRGANHYTLDETHRSIHDALCAVSKTLEHTDVVAGGGAVETALAVYLEDFSLGLSSREHVAVAAFAASLTVIPRTLALNAARDATDLYSRLHRIHTHAQKPVGVGLPSGLKSELQGCVSGGGCVCGNSTLCVGVCEGLRYFGLDLVNGTVRNSVTGGVLEPAMSKVKSLRFATEAAITILRVDDLIKLDPPPERQ